MHGEADRGSDQESEGFRNGDVTHLLTPGETQTGALFPLPLWNGLDAAAPDFGQERPGMTGEGERGRGQRRHFEAE